MLAVPQLGNFTLIPERIGGGVEGAGVSFLDLLMGLKAEPLEDGVEFLEQLVSDSEEIELARSQEEGPKRQAPDLLAGLVPEATIQALPNTQRPLNVSNAPSSILGEEGIETVDANGTIDPREFTGSVSEPSGEPFQLPTARFVELTEKSRDLQGSIGKAAESHEPVKREKVEMTKPRILRSDGAMERYAALAPKLEQAERVIQRPVESAEVIQSKPIDSKEGDTEARPIAPRLNEKSRSALEANPFQWKAIENSGLISSTAWKRDLIPERVALPEVMERVETLVHRGGGEMVLSLTPPELGTVEIRVSTDGNRVAIEMRSESEFAKSVLESALPELKGSLEAQDLTPTRVEVFAGSGGFNTDSSMANRDSFNPWSGGEFIPSEETTPGNISKSLLATRPKRVASGVDLKV